MYEQGKLPSIYQPRDEQFLSTTLFLHYCYKDVEGEHFLKDIIACCVPNGLLQDEYNPNPDTSFWVAGRNSPIRGEEFRVRVSFKKLKAMKNWRVQTIHFDNDQKILRHTWDD